MVLVLLLAAALLFAPDSAQGKDIYRWIDEAGDTHYATEVPKKYKGTASKVESNVNVLPDSRLEGRAGRSAGMPVSPPLPVSPENRNESAVTSIGTYGTSGSSGGQGGTDDCDSLRRQYWESQACFNRYRNVNGSVKLEAFRHCTEVESPIAQCGPLITEP